MQYREFILNFILHGYTKETLVTKTDTSHCVYASKIILKKHNYKITSKRMKVSFQRREDSTF